MHAYADRVLKAYRPGPGQVRARDQLGLDVLLLLQQRADDVTE